VGGKSLLQVHNNLIERAHICLIKRRSKHMAPIIGIHAPAAHLIQQRYARRVQIKNVFFLRHVN
jgi:hypothetical protein